MKDKIREIAEKELDKYSVYNNDVKHKVIMVTPKGAARDIAETIYQATRLDEDSINKIETLIGFVRASGEGKFSFQDKMLVDVADEAQEWIDTFKKQDELTKE